MSTATTNKKKKETEHIQIDIYLKTSTWKSLVNGELYQDTSKQDVLKQRSSSQTALRSDGKLTDIDGQSTPFDLTKDVFGTVKPKS